MIFLSLRKDLGLAVSATVHATKKLARHLLMSSKRNPLSYKSNLQVTRVNEMTKRDELLWFVKKFS